MSMYSSGGGGAGPSRREQREAKVVKLWMEIRVFKKVLEKIMAHIIRIDVEEKDDLCDDISDYLEIIDNLHPELSFDPASLEITLEKIHDLIRRFPVNMGNTSLEDDDDDDEDNEERLRLEKEERMDKLFPNPSYTANIYNDIDERVIGTGGGINNNNNDHERGRGLLGPSPSSPDPQFPFPPATNSLPLPLPNAIIPPNQYAYKQNMNMNMFSPSQIIHPPIAIPEIPQVPVQQQNLNNPRFFFDHRQQQQQNSQYNNNSFLPPTGNLSIQPQPPQQFQQFSPPSNNMYNTNTPAVPNSNLANSFRGSQQSSFNTFPNNIDKQSHFHDQFQRRPTPTHNNNQNNSPISWRNNNNNNNNNRQPNNSNRNNSVSGNDNRNSSYNSSTYNQHRPSSYHHNHQQQQQQQQQQHYKSNYNNNKNDTYHSQQNNNRYPHSQNSGLVARQNPNNNSRYFNPEQFPISPPLLPPSVSSHPVLPPHNHLNNNSSNQRSLYNQDRESREIREKEIADQNRITKELEVEEIKRISKEKATNCFLNKSRSGPSNSKPNNVPPPRIASNQILAVPKHPAPAFDDRRRTVHFKTNQPLSVQQKAREEAERNRNLNLKEKSIRGLTDEETQEKLERVRKKLEDNQRPGINFIDPTTETSVQTTKSIKALQNALINDLRKNKKGRSSTEKEKEKGKRKRKNSDEGGDDDGKMDNSQNASHVKPSSRSRRRSSQSDTPKFQPKSQPHQISPNRVSTDEINKPKSSSSKSVESSKKSSKIQKSKDKSETRIKSSTSGVVSLKISKNKRDVKSKANKKKESKIKKKKSQNSGKTPAADDENISEDRDSDIIEIIQDNIQEPQVPQMIVEVERDDNDNDEFGREVEEPSVTKLSSKSKSKFKSKTMSKITNKKTKSKSLKQVMDKGKSISKMNKKGNKKNLRKNINAKKNVKKTNLKKNAKNTNAPPVRITRASAAAEAAAKARLEQINNPITIDDDEEPQEPQYLPSIVFDENFKVKEETMDQVEKKFDINSIEFDQNNLVNNDKDEEPGRIDQEEASMNVAAPLLEGDSNMMDENNLETDAENTINERGDDQDECIVNAEFSVGAFDENQEEVVKIKEELLFEDEVYESNQKRGRKRKMSESSVEVVKCDYCSFTAENIVPHYVEMHPGRTNPQACLTPETIEAFVQNNVSNCFQLMEIQFKRTGLNKIWPCLWCSDTYDSLQEYYDHLSSHTGEYQYGCSLCSCILPYKRLMKSHLKSTHKLKEITGEISQNMKKMYEPSYFEGLNELSAFMCGNCYYFQLQAENIGTHLNECKHSSSDVYSIRFTIAPEDDDELNGIKKEKDDIKTEFSDDNFNSSVFLGGKKPIEPNIGDDDVQIIYEHNMMVPDDDAVPLPVDLNKGFISNLYNKLIKKESTTDTTDNDNEDTFISMVKENVPSPVERNTEIIQLDCESTLEDLLSNVIREEIKHTETETAPSDIPPIESPISTYDDDQTMNDYFEPDSDEESEDSEEDEEDESPPPKNDVVVADTNQDKDKDCEESANSNDQNASSSDNIVNEQVHVQVKEEPMEFPETSLEPIEPIEKSPEESEESSKIDEDEIKILDEVVVLDIQDLDNKRITNLRGYDLYKCGNEGCNYKASLGSIFKDHISSCRFQTDGGKLFPCSHCERKIKTLPSFMEHLKVHGIQKQKCSLCNFRCWVNTELTKHFKSVHKVNNYKVIKSNGSDPDFYLYPKDVANKLLKPEVLKMNSFLYSSRIEYYPSEIELISHQSQIFPSTVHCALCSFENKVRSNLIRHLKLHLLSDNDGGQTIVPTIGPVNPVPHLEKNEMMFDKMTNWAGSSHANKAPSLSGSDEKPVPEFVKEQFRYVCSVEECRQITVDDNMLRTHMRALHSEVDLYKCPHCLSKSTSNLGNQVKVPIEKLGHHLKFHGSKLYKCGYCDYLQIQLKFVEKHVAEKHSDKKPHHVVLRNLDDDGIPNEAPPISRRSSSDDTQKQNEERTSWRCGICKSCNSSWTDAKSHCQSVHKVNGQFMCSICQFTCDIVSEISTHVSGCSRGKEKALIMVMFLRNDAVENGISNEESSNLPLWRPNNISIKHIRGIFLEEEKRYTPINNQPKSSTSFAKLISSNTSSTLVSPPANNLSLSPTKPGSVMYACPKCGKYKSKNSRDMTVHLYNELHYQRFACKLCPLRFVTLFSLKAHIDMDHKVEYVEESHLNLLPFNREIEEAVTKEIDNQTKQLKNPSQWEKEPRPNDLNLSCKHCQHNFSSYHNYRTHVLAKHIASERYKCDYCPAGFWNPGLVKAHHNKTHVQDPPLPMMYSTDEQLEKMLTPEFWNTEYGIPLPTSSNNNKTNSSTPAPTTM